MGAKDVSARLQVAPQLLEVVDLAVEDHPDRFILIGQRLTPGAQIDNTQPRMPQPHSAATVLRAEIGKVFAVLIRPAMRQRQAHTLDIRRAETG